MKSSPVVWFTIGVTSTLFIMVVLYNSFDGNNCRSIIRFIPTMFNNGLKPEAEFNDSMNHIIPKPFLDFARKMNKNGQIVILAVFNDAQLTMAHSWLCNTLYMGIHKQVFLVVTDNQSRDSLRRHWPEIHVEALPGFGSSIGDRVYKTVGYVRLTNWRNHILHEFLKAKVELILCEMDALWIRNPIPETKRLAEGYDMAAIEAGYANVVGFGYMYLKPTAAILKLWKNFTGIFDEGMSKFDGKGVNSLGPKTPLSDQNILCGMINKGFANVRLKRLSLKQFPDGRWFRNRNAKTFKNSFILNNNCIVGNKAKIDRFKKFGYWFWKEDSEQCDLEQVNKTVLG